MVLIIAFVSCTVGAKMSHFMN